MANNGSDLRDGAIAADIRDLLRADPLVRGSRLELEVRGGVVHLGGQVGSEEARARARSLAQRIRGVMAVWDTAAGPEGKPLKRIDIGCGSTKQDRGAVGVDAWPTAAADVRVDLERGLPFATGSIDRVFAVHVLEHVRDLFGVMDELHRILRPDGMLHLMVPHCGHVIAVADPTHVRFFNLQTVKYFCRPQFGMEPWWPHIAATDGVSVFADLSPATRGDEGPEAVLARWFD